MKYYKNGKYRRIWKNWCCTWYYCDTMIRFWDKSIDFSDILLDKKLCKEKCENILIYGISYKASTSAKPLRIRFDKIDLLNYLYRCIIHDKIRYSVLFDYSYYGKIYDKIVLITIFQERNCFILSFT